MTISDTQYTAWLKSQDAVRCILVEVDIGLAAGGTTTRRLSNKGYVTGVSDTPASTNYLPRINGGIKFTRKLDISGQASLSFGDVELNNTDGFCDSWVYDYWVNRNFRVYLGDVTWARSDFRLVFSGLTLGADAKSRKTFNIKISDKLQRLNTTVTETKLGGTTSLYDSIVPLTFGECHNVEPLLTNPALLEYQVHQGAIESIIEVRDNGVPVSFSSTPATGKFTLNQAPVGQITCSVQGAVIPSTILFHDDQLQNTANWTQSKIASTTTDAIQGPYGASGATCTGLVPNSNAGAVHYIQNAAAITGLTAATSYTTSVFMKVPSTGNFSKKAEVRVYDSTTTDYIGVLLDFTTGTAVSTSNAGVGSSITGTGVVNLGNGWFRVWVSGYPNSTTTGRINRFIPYSPTGVLSFTADGTSTYLYLSGYQFDTGIRPQSYWNGASVGGGNIFRNSPADLIRYVMTTWNSVAVNKFVSADYNDPAWMLAECQYRQPVGIFLKDRGNVFDVCNQIASSVGARIVIDNAGLVTLVRLADQTAGTGTQIAATDFLDRSLEISSLTPVTAGVTLGYCKNWTVQSQVAAGVVASSTALFAEEWLTTTQTDSAAAANYNLYLTPDQTDTLLLVASDAATEAIRRLNMFNRQRMVLKYTGFYHLINENLGGAQTITHPRFGLASGKTGQVISISVDLINPHVDFEVLV